MIVALIVLGLNLFDVLPAAPLLRSHQNSLIKIHVPEHLSKTQTLFVYPTSVTKSRNTTDTVTMTKSSLSSVSRVCVTVTGCASEGRRGGGGLAPF